MTELTDDEILNRAKQLIQEHAADSYEYCNAHSEGVACCVDYLGNTALKIDKSGKSNGFINAEWNDRPTAPRS